MTVALTFGFFFSFFCVSSTVHAELGARLVTAVNNIPYTQRQVELYVTVKECLRQTTPTDRPVVSAANWREALAAFSEEMMILQEAQRLGSFSAPDQTLDKFTTMLQAKLAPGTALHAVTVRLAADDTNTARALDAVLRVAAFRRSKDKQEQQSALAKAAKKGETQSRWLTELKERASVRTFVGAEAYILLTSEPRHASPD